MIIEGDTIAAKIRIQADENWKKIMDKVFFKDAFHVVAALDDNTPMMDDFKDPVTFSDFITKADKVTAYFSPVAESGPVDFSKVETWEKVGATDSLAKDQKNSTFAKAISQAEKDHKSFVTVVEWTEEENGQKVVRKGIVWSGSNALKWQTAMAARAQKDDKITADLLRILAITDIDEQVQAIKATYPDIQIDTTAGNNQLFVGAGLESDSLGYFTGVTKFVRANEVSLKTIGGKDPHTALVVQQNGTADVLKYCPVKELLKVFSIEDNTGIPSTKAAYFFGQNENLKQYYSAQVGEFLVQRANANLPKVEVYIRGKMVVTGITSGMSVLLSFAASPNAGLVFSKLSNTAYDLIAQPKIMQAAPKPAEINAFFGKYQFLKDKGLLEASREDQNKAWLAFGQASPSDRDLYVTNAGKEANALFTTDEMKMMVRYLKKQHNESVVRFILSHIASVAGVASAFLPTYDAFLDQPGIFMTVGNETLWFDLDGNLIEGVPTFKQFKVVQNPTLYAFMNGQYVNLLTGQANLGQLAPVSQNPGGILGQSMGFFVERVDLLQGGGQGGTFTFQLSERAIAWLGGGGDGGSCQAEDQRLGDHGADQLLTQLIILLSHAGKLRQIISVGRHLTEDTANAHQQREGTKQD